MRTWQTVAKAHLYGVGRVIWFDLRHLRITSPSWVWYRVKLAYKSARSFA